MVGQPPQLPFFHASIPVLSSAYPLSDLSEKKA